MKHILLILIGLSILACNRKEMVSIELFNPNPLLTPEAIYNLNLNRVYGIDIDMYEIINNDTIIRLSTGDSMVFSQYWIFQIDSSISLSNIEQYFNTHYHLKTISRDTIYEELIQKTYFSNLAISTINNLEFKYEIVKDYFIKYENKYYIVVSYIYPKYKEYKTKVCEKYNKVDNGTR